MTEGFRLGWKVGNIVGCLVGLTEGLLVRDTLGVKVWVGLYVGYINTKLSKDPYIVDIEFESDKGTNILV